VLFPALFLPRQKVAPFSYGKSALDKAANFFPEEKNAAAILLFAKCADLFCETKNAAAGIFSTPFLSGLKDLFSLFLPEGKKGRLFRRSEKVRREKGFHLNPGLELGKLRSYQAGLQPPFLSLIAYP